MLHPFPGALPFPAPSPTRGTAPRPWRSTNCSAMTSRTRARPPCCCSPWFGNTGAEVPAAGRAVASGARDHLSPTGFSNCAASWPTRTSWRSAETSPYNRVSARQPQVDELRAVAAACSPVRRSRAAHQPPVRPGDLRHRGSTRWPSGASAGSATPPSPCGRTPPRGLPRRLRRLGNDAWALAESLAATQGDLQVALRRWERRQLAVGRAVLERTHRNGNRVTFAADKCSTRHQPPFEQSNGQRDGRFEEPTFAPTGVLMTACHPT
jgi:hypothetical protein